MNERDVEALLRERDRRSSKRVLSEERAGRCLELLRAEAHAERARPFSSISKLALLGGLAALFLAVLAPLTYYGLRPPAGRAPLALDALLLDELGRPLARAERGGASLLPEGLLTFLLEVEARELGFFSVVLYTRAGKPHLPVEWQARALDPGVVETLRIDWRDEQENPPAALLLIGSKRALPQADLERHLPEIIAPPAGMEIGDGLQQIAAKLATALDCSAQVFVLSPAPH